MQHSHRKCFSSSIKLHTLQSLLVIVSFRFNTRRIGSGNPFTGSYCYCWLQNCLCSNCAIIFLCNPFCCRSVYPWLLLSLTVLVACQAAGVNWLGRCRCEAGLRTCVGYSPSTYFTNGYMSSNSKYCKDMYCSYVNNYQIRSQFCTCHDSWAVVTCATLLSDWIVKIEAMVQCIFTSLQWWTHKPFVKCSPGQQTK